jgi:hypothetical protein
LDDPEDEEAPSEWLISRVCEEFGGYPAEALEAIENDVGGLIFKIIDFRAYAKAKHAYEEGQKETDLNRRPQGPLIDIVRDIDWELNKERLAKANSKD